MVAISIPNRVLFCLLLTALGVTYVTLGAYIYAGSLLTLLRIVHNRGEAKVQIRVMYGFVRG
jgi:hypothetical protein